MKKNPLLSLVERVGDPEVAPGLRGVIMSLIIFKVITVQLMKDGGSSFLLWLDRIASVGFVLAVMGLFLLLWNKYFINKRQNK